jgi:S1-C subfamily serine protease
MEDPQPMITFNVYDRVFQVKWHGATGTAFTTDLDGRQYLISARHVFKGLSQSATIEVYRNSQWQGIDVELVGVPEGNADVIVLSPSCVLSPPHPLPLTKGDVVLSQDVHFVGFPFGLHSKAKAVDGMLHIPLVKRACLSGHLEDGKHRLWLLDGFNNPGFSGGPVIRSDIKSLGSNLAVFGIISGYRFHEEPVFDGTEKTNLRVQANTGIIYAYSAAVALDIISANPSGIPVG